MGKLDEILDTSLKNRKTLDKYLKSLSIKSLFEIPSGYNNNIIWQIGHMVSVQQQLVYGLSGLPLLISKDFVKKYGRGSSPDAAHNESTIEEIHSLLFKTIEITKTDLKKGVFKTFNSYKTLAGTELHNVKEALVFNNFHDEIHLDRIQLLRKAIET